MKMFDAHSDMLYDLHRKALAGKTKQFQEFHVPQLKNSIIKGAIWTMYSPDEFDLIPALQMALDLIDISLLPGFSVILGLEGLRNLPTYHDIDEVYKMGFRHAMLTWNEENQYATGAKSDPSHGLKPEGKLLLKRMEQLEMIIDLAHLNEKSFYEALEVISPDYPYIMYSHGCVKKLCDHPRNLTDEQMIALKERKAFFGLTLANNFVSPKHEEQDLEHFIVHLEEAIKIMGIDNVGFGFDFMDYLSEFPNSNINDLGDATKVYKIIDALKERGYSQEDINKLAYENIYRRFNKMITLKG